MPFTHDTGVYNVQSSLTAWLQTQLTANVPPATGALTLNLNYPDQPLVPPTVSVTFLGGDADPMTYHGGVVGATLRGGRRWGLMSIDCWVSTTHSDWRAELMQMQDSITKAFMTLLATGGSIPIYDFYTSSAAPATVAYRVFIGWVRESETAPDPNPAIKRKHLMVQYNWIERA